MFYLMLRWFTVCMEAVYRIRNDSILRPCSANFYLGWVVGHHEVDGAENVYAATNPNIVVASVDYRL